MHLFSWEPLYLNYTGSSFGRGQMILRQPDGVYAAATEPRTDGVVAAW